MRDIKLVRLSTGTLVICVEEEMIPEFKTLVNRACNCWPDASAEMKEFADNVIEGRVWQDYKSQDTSARKRGKLK